MAPLSGILNKRTLWLLHLKNLITEQTAFNLVQTQGAKAYITPT